MLRSVIDLLRTARARRFIWAILVLWLSWRLLLSAAVRSSITVDEPGHLFRGTAYLLQGATQFLWGHPLLASTVSALPLLTEPDLRLPLDSPYWQNGPWQAAALDFLWRTNAEPLRLIFLGRLPTMWMTLILGALATRWAGRLAGEAAAALVSAWLLLDPNVLAHGGLITSDIPLTLAMTTVLLTWQQLARARRNRRWWSVLLGVALGAAAMVKFSSAALAPILAFSAVRLAAHSGGASVGWKERSGRLIAHPIWRYLAIAAVTAAGAVWAFYGFRLRPWPGGAFWNDLLWQLDYFSRPHGAYLLGRVNPTGWWYYFPVAFLLKTPLGLLVLLLVAQPVGRRVRALPRVGAGRTLLMSSVALYVGIALITPLNIGYRHLLPILPWLVVWAAVQVGPAFSAAVAARRPWLLLWIILLFWPAGLALMQTPHFLAYFNVLAGGPDRRWRLLSDSNIDWGQDLPALATWQRDHGDRPLYLSYFGMAPPSAYGVHAVMLPTWSPAPAQTSPDRQTYNPRNPAPGIYAISVTNLHGLVLGDDSNLYEFFRNRAPIARLGGSLFVYEVAPSGPPREVVFAGGVRPATLTADLQELWNGNDVRVRWLLDPAAFLWPAEGGWLVRSADFARAAQSEPLIAALPPDAGSIIKSADQQALALAPPTWASALPADWRIVGESFGGVLTWLGARPLETAEADAVAVATLWRVETTTDRPLKIFVHALNAQGDLIGQWDGLGVAAETLRPGDLYWQVHRFSVVEPAERLLVGVYDGDSLQRLQTADGRDAVALPAP